MFEKRVVIGKKYCIFAPGPVTVTADMNNIKVTLVNAIECGKYFFTAPTTRIYSSVNPSCIFEPDNTLNYNIGNTPSWLYSLKVSLQILLGETAVKLNLTENKLVVYTDRADDIQLEAVTGLLARVLPQNIEVVHSNYLPFLPAEYESVDWIASTGNGQVIILNGEYENAGCLITCAWLGEVASQTLHNQHISNLNGLYCPHPRKNKEEQWMWNFQSNYGEGYQGIAETLVKMDVSFRFKGSPTQSVLNVFTIKDTRISKGNKILLFSYDSWIGYSFNGRIYDAKYSDGEVIVHDLKPALDPTGAPCMYDLVNRKAFYNAGYSDFLYPNAAPVMSTDLEDTFYAKLTEHGVRRLYHVPKGCNMTKDEYAAANGFKELVEPPMPYVGYWRPEWRETETQLILEWIETEPYTNESF